MKLFWSWHGLIITFWRYIGDLGEPAHSVARKPVNGGQGETIAYWDPENGADEDSVPRYMISDVAGPINGYYNWYASTAGSGTSSMIGVSAPDSICPSGWQLPTTWNTLMRSTYGLTQGTNYTAAALGTRKTLARFPFTFISVGVIYSNSESISYAGTRFYFATSWAISTSEARTLYTAGNTAGGAINSFDHSIDKTVSPSVRCTLK